MSRLGKEQSEIGNWAGTTIERARKFVPILAVTFSSGIGALSVASTPVSTADLPPAPKLIEKYCYDCHADGMSKGKVALDDWLATATNGPAASEWQRAWKIVRHEFMPPAGEPMPTPAERKAMTDWMAADLLGVDFKSPDPGRVTLRRLNRMEYEHTVHDLFGVDLGADQIYSSDTAQSVLRLRDRLPPDDTAFGFDNIGDFQSVSPALLEKFFDIAEFVVDRVIVQDGPRDPERQLAPRDVKAEKSETSKETNHSVDFKVANDGLYRVELQFTLGGWQEYGGAYDFTATVNDKPIAKDLLEIGGYKAFKYSTNLQLTAGSHALRFTTDPKKPDSKGEFKHLEVRPKMRLIGPIGAGLAEYPESHQRIFFKGEAPTDPAARRAYAREILDRIASRAFRRPVDPETLDGLVGLAEGSERFERGIGQALSAILTSPKFLFRAETQPQPDDPKAIHPLDEFALASRLSYLLWLSLPDAELTALASAGKLRENMRPQVERMLADEKSERFFEDFPGQWLRTRNVLMTSISKMENEINAVRGSMKRETEMLFEHIAREDRDLIELITADYTFLDKKLADFYGIKGVEGPGFEKVKLDPATKRGGILTHGTFLVSTSNPNRSSPVKRGLFVLENLLAVEPPPPPPDIPPLDDVNIAGGPPKTGRELLAAHREHKACASCHAHFDPIGVVLENYDLIGQWRDTENGVPIEPSEKTITGETLRGIDDLRQLLASRKDKLYHGISEKLLTYALGRGLEPADSVTVDRVASKVAEDGGKFSTLLMAVVESPAFQMRRGDSGEVKAMPRRVMPTAPPPEKRRPKRRPRPGDQERRPEAAAAEAAAKVNATAETPTTADKI